MGIEIDNPAFQPEVVLNKIFLTELSIEQMMSPVENTPPIYQVSIEYRKYGVDVHGKRHFGSETTEILIKDFLSLAKSKYVEGDPTLISALKAIESAVAALIVHDVGVGAKVV
jgi:hypothetical protein